jgi:probable HAF family extracellular repeat protein
MKKQASACVPLLLVLLGDILSAQSFYKATALQSLEAGTPANGNTVALGINASGIIVGTSELLNGERHATTWSTGGTVRDLGTLGGNYGVGFAINNLGQVVGSSSPLDNSRSDPFLWTQSGGMQDLGGLGSGTDNAALAINDNTAIVGRSCLDRLNHSCHAFLWTQVAGMQDLGTLGGSFSEGTGINAAGHVTGWSTHPDGTRHGFLWTAQTGMQELLPNEMLETFPWAINDSDQVIGAFIDPQDNQSHAFSWTPSTGLEDLGTLGSGFSEALAINDSGDIVGFARTADNTGYSVIWKNGAAAPQKLALLVSPNNPLLLGEAATGINADGQISANGRKKLYLLNPRTQTVLTSSPNPSTQGQAVTFTAVVTSYLGVPPDGETVSFMKGTTVLGTGSLNHGAASFTTSTLKVGTTYIKAVYGGDASFLGSKSNTVQQVVN